MKTTINIKQITQVQFFPEKENYSYEVVQETERMPSFFEDVWWFITRRPIRTRAGIRFCWSSLITPFDEWADTRYFIRDNKVWNKSNVVVRYTSEYELDRYFDTEAQAYEFYTILKDLIPNKYSF